MISSLDVTSEGAARRSRRLAPPRNTASMCMKPVGPTARCFMNVVLPLLCWFVAYVASYLYYRNGPITVPIVYVGDTVTVLDTLLGNDVVTIPDPLIFEAALKLQTPIVLRGTGVRSWGSYWGCGSGLKGLANLLPSRVKAMRSTGTVFSYMNKAPLHRESGSNFSWPNGSAAVRRITLRPAALFARLAKQDESSAEYVTLTQIISGAASPALNADIRYNERPVFYPDEAKGKRTAGRMRVWIGRDTTTHTHVDESRNFYTQVCGRKRFVLWRPAAHRDLVLYPESHPGYRQAQRATADIFDSISARPYVVTLWRGDTLYIPPLFFHRAIAMENNHSGFYAPEPISVSVNVWTESAVQRLKARLLRRGLAPIATKACPRFGAKHNRSRVSDGAPCRAALRQFVRDVVRAVVSSTADADATAVNRFLRLDVLARWRGSELRPCRAGPATPPLPPPRRSAKSRAHVAALAAEFRVDGLATPGGSSFLLPGARQIVLADYVEIVARTALGANAVCSFLESCVVDLAPNGGGELLAQRASTSRTDDL